MPATITHSYFTVDVYDILPDIIKDKIIFPNEIYK